jgi:type I restriction enzyme, S subunit
MDDLPDGWCAVTLEEIADFNPGIEKEGLKADELVPFVPMPAVEPETGHIDTSERRPFKAVKSGFTSFATGDVLFAKITPCMENGKMAIVPPLPKSIGFGTTEFHVLRSRGAVDSRLLYHFVSSLALRHEAQHHMTGAVGQKRVPKRFLETKPFKLPPITEQERIVERIETLFAELGKGEEALRAVQTLLARYRQSVLKAAVTGALTADWRSVNRQSAETGQDLLARILKHRRETWKGSGKYEEPSAPDSAALPNLPDGWAWATFEQLFHVFGGATPSRRDKSFWGGDIPWVSSGEVSFTRIRSTRECVTEAGYQSCSTKLHPAGTVLLAMIGEGKTRGQAAILDIAACNNQNAAAIRVSETEIAPEYVYYFLLGNYEQSRMLGQGGNQPALNGHKVKAFTLPLPTSTREIDEIVSRVDMAFAMAERVEQECAAGFARTAALRQSILRDAFAGKLVPQNPADEPAADLLARIRASHEGAPKRGRKKAMA